MAKKDWLKVGADRKTFGERLEDLMKESHITQAQLEAETGVKQSAICEYINGRSKNGEERESRAPDCGTVIALAKYFSVSTDYLLGLTTAKSISPDMRQAVEFTGLSEKAIDVLISSQHGFGKNSQDKYSEILNWLLEKPSFVFSIISGMGSLKDFSALYQKITPELDKQFTNGYKRFISGDKNLRDDMQGRDWLIMEKEVSDNISLIRFRLNKVFDSTVDDFVKEFCSPTPDDYHKRMMEVLSNGID